ncbi:hypothetical protein [Halarchaeum acidiphilum]|uniref:hypothetical protein n=1 Tax=Halarchaeum acidiphilum TaxID=489138 RepID=UPI0011D1A503|nr:hypothetical protein [Halarchaeum acidiphilum]
MSSEAPYSPTDFSEVFYDTSVLLDFVLSQDDGEAKKLLKNHPSANYTGSTVEREFRNLKERREKILKSVYKSDDLDDWNPPSDVDMSPNDRDWCGDLLTELDEMTTRDKIENRLDFEQRKLNRGIDLLFDLRSNLIESVWPNNLETTLLGRLDFVDNNNDRHVICESADWACSSDSDNLLTSDCTDLLSNRQRISEEVGRNRNLETLHLFSADEFLSQDSAF